MRTLPPQELTDEQRKAFEAIPALPNPYLDWLKLATKHAVNDSHIAAATEAVLEINDTQKGN